MKKILILTLFSISVFAQTEYKIEPGTKGNQIILGINNESKTEELEHITIEFAGIAYGIEMQTKEAKVERLKHGEEQEVSFIFDAKRMPTVKKDTLKFLITDNRGGQWEQNIILVYDLPTEYTLEQNYPNPFNPSTVISYQIPVNDKVTLKIDILGREVTTLVDDFQEAGYYEKKFDARGLSSGVYFSLLQSEKTNLVRKMLLVK